MHPLATTMLDTLEMEMPDRRFGHLTERVAEALTVHVSLSAGLEQLTDDLNTIDDARMELIEIRDSFANVAAEAQKRVRAIERQHMRDDLKITQVERNFKSDPDHAAMVALASRCEAAVTNCDGSTRVLSDKAYRIGQLLNQKLQRQ